MPKSDLNQIAFLKVRTSDGSFYNIHVWDDAKSYVERESPDGKMLPIHTPTPVYVKGHLPDGCWDWRALTDLAEQYEQDLSAIDNQ